MESVLKLVWDSDDGELVFKRLDTGRFCFVPVAVLELEKDEAKRLADCLYSVVREDSTVFEMFGRYEVMMDTCFVHGTKAVKVSIAECSGESFKPLMSAVFDGYVSGLSLVDGIRRFRSENDF